MGHVLMRCPTTNRLVPTGVITDPASFASSQFEDNESDCAACGRMHTWSKKDVVLEEDLKRNG